jgi:phage terminase small subunit
MMCLMGKRGPLPQPAVLKEIAGTYRADRDVALKAPVGEPPCPPELDAIAQRLWREIVPELISLGTLARIDGGTLAGYCATLSAALRAQRRAGGGSRSTAAAPGSPSEQDREEEDVSEWQAEKAATEARKLWVLVDRFAARLGLNYAARGRLR